MVEIKNQYSFAGIYLPKRKNLIGTLQIISFFVNDATLTVSTVLLLLWILHVFTINIPLVSNVNISPLARVLFIFSGIPLLFSAKQHIYNRNGLIQARQFRWIILVPIFFAGITALFGFLSFTRLNHMVGLSQLQTSQYSGLCFFLIGLGLIPPYTRIPHRFHITQSLIFSVIVFNATVLLESIYQLLSPLPMQHIFFVPVINAVLFIFFCLGILCRWSNRGYSANFTIDSVDSMLALRLIVITLITSPVIGFIVLVITQKTQYNVYEIVTLVVVLITVMSFTVIWINVKFLYNYDVEFFLMKEALRIHSIDLNLEKNQLEKKMGELEQAKEQYLEKLNNQDQLRSITDSLS